MTSDTWTASSTLCPRDVVSPNVGGVGARVHPQACAQGGAEAAVCEGNMVTTQLHGRSTLASPRYQMKEPRVNPWVLSFTGGEQPGFGRRFAEGRIGGS